MHCYVWYRVARADGDTDRAVRGMMARLACRTGIPGQLLKKSEDPTLWMESYQGITDLAEFTRTMTAKADEADLGMFIDGERHVELFRVDWSTTPTCSDWI